MFEFAVVLVHDDNNDVIVRIPLEFLPDLFFPFINFVRLPLLYDSHIVVVCEVCSKILSDFNDLVINSFNHELQIFRINV